MSAELRLGLLIYGSLETVSGGYLYDRKLVEHLLQQGDRVAVVSLPWRDYARHLGDNFSARLLRQLETLPVDVLLQDELNHPSLAWLNTRLKQTAPYPLVSIVHHLRSSELRPAWQNNLYRRVERRYLNSVDGFVYNSRTTQAVVVPLLERPRPSLVAYPAGDRLNPHITTEEILRRASASGPLRLIFLGNLIERKGLHTLLEACSRLPPGSWTLEIVGREDADPPYAHRMRHMAEGLGLQDQVRFHGNPPDAQLSALLHSSHLLVVPSSFEGFGIVYLEGMGFGLPAVGCTSGAAGEVITHAENGLLVPPEDPAALGRALGELAADRAKLAAMGLAARQRYLQHPTWEQSATAIRAFLIDMLKK